MTDAKLPVAPGEATMMKVAKQDEVDYYIAELITNGELPNTAEERNAFRLGWKFGHESALDSAATQLSLLIRK